MKSDVGLTITIVSYNSYQAITECLGQLIETSLFKVVIIDNNSPDGSGKKLAQKYPNVQVIENNTNLGYGRAANIALNSCTTPYLFLINPDLKASEYQTLKLLDTFRSLPNEVALLAPAAEPYDHTNEGPLEKDWVIGAAMMFKLENLKKVGFFDNNIFLFYEETDLCLRIRKCGYKIMLDTNLYIEHLSGQSSTPNPDTEALKNWHYGWSKMYYFHKHGLNKGKQNIYASITKYLFKYLLATTPLKRAQYKNRLKGCKAFLKERQSLIF